VFAHTLSLSEGGPDLVRNGPETTREGLSPVLFWSTGGPALAKNISRARMAQGH
jgi:hypothetical protein